MGQWSRVRRRGSANRSSRGEAHREPLDLPARLSVATMSRMADPKRELRVTRVLVRFALAAAIVVGLFLQFAEVLEETFGGYDTRTTAELSLDAWASTGKRPVAWRKCYDRYPREDGQIRCAVRFEDSPAEHFIWCAGDRATEKGCRWF